MDLLRPRLIMGKSFPKIKPGGLLVSQFNTNATRFDINIKFYVHYLDCYVNARSMGGFGRTSSSVYKNTEYDSLRKKYSVKVLMPNRRRYSLQASDIKLVQI